MPLDEPTRRKQSIAMSGVKARVIPCGSLDKLLQQNASLDTQMMVMMMVMMVMMGGDDGDDGDGDGDDAIKMAQRLAASV